MHPRQRSEVEESNDTRTTCVCSPLESETPIKSTFTNANQSIILATPLKVKGEAYVFYHDHADLIAMHDYAGVRFHTRALISIVVTVER